MDRGCAEYVYYTLLGEAEEGFCVPGVENLFEEGSACDRAYEQMLAAYARLRERLGIENEDADVEQIINALRTIERIVSMKMFECGAQASGKF